MSSPYYLRRTRGEIIFNAFNISFMIILAIVTIYPIWHVVCASFSVPNDLLMHRGLLFLPKGINFASYRFVAKNPMIISGYLNTIYYVGVGTFINIVMTIIAAFVLSRKSFLLRDKLMMFAVFTMFFSGGMIPTFIIVRNLGLLDSRLSLILPGAIGTWNMIIMRTSFASIPESLESSAKVDGANDFVILLRIILPLSKAVIAVMVLFYSVQHWNSWFSAVIYIRDRTLYPLQLVLREILIAGDLSNMNTDISFVDDVAVGATIKYATIVVATLPVLAFYPFIQKYFVKGMMVGAIKG